MQPERLYRAGQRRIRVISVQLHRRLRQNGAKLLQRMRSGGKAALNRLRTGFVLDEQCVLTTLHGCVVVGAISLQREDKK